MTCAQCNTELPIQTGGGARRIYCSRKCRDAANWAKNKLGPFSGICDHCSKPWVNPNHKQRFCSPECAYDFGLARANKRYADFRAANPLPATYAYTCDGCAIEIIKPHKIAGIAIQRGVYCEPCRLAAQRARYRKKTVVRQSKTVKPSGLWIEEIIATWGSDCYVCKEPVDMSLPRTSRQGATVEHIIPLSKNGSDEIDNLRISHWICNNAKSNKLEEELNG